MEPEAQGPDPSEGTSSTDDFVSGILAQIPEADRPVVEPHFKTWNESVNKRFESIHDEYKPYKDFGSVDEIKLWKDTVDFLREDPKEFLNLLAKDLNIDLSKLLEAPPPTPAPTPAGGGGVLPRTSSQELPKEYQEFLERQAKQDELLQQLARAVIGQETTRREAEEDAQLNSWLEDMHKKHGDFEDDYVLLKIHNGADPDAAIKEFQSKFSTKPNIPTPPVLSGGGIPSGQQDVKNMSRDETKNLVAGILAAHQQQE